MLNRAEIESLGILKIVEVTEPTEAIPAAYLTGCIDRVTAYEQVPTPLPHGEEGAS
jgi:hypothetical protein